MAEPILLGVRNGREYYLAPADKTHPEPYLVWRVPDIREGIRARKGWKILGADYSQIEVRIMAHESKDEWLTTALNSGKDIHCYMASDVHGIEYADFYKHYKDKTSPLHNLYYGWRSEIKTTTFGVPYGAGAGQIARQINSGRKPGDTSPLYTEEQAEQLIESYFAKAKGLKRWLDKQAEWAQIHGESKSLGGHYRFYQLPKEGNSDYDKRMSQVQRWSGNHPIQAACADTLKMAVGKIYLDLRGGKSSAATILDGHFLLFVHDELVLTASVEHVEAVKAIMIKNMQWAYDQLIGLKNIIHETDVTVNDYWEKG